MTSFEKGIVNALEQMGDTDWIGIIFNIVGIIVASAFSAWAAFRIAKYQTEKQITKQNSLEVKKEKRMLATQIRLDKYEDLYESLTEYTRLVNQSYLNVLYYIHSDEYSEKRTIEELRIIEDDLQNEIGIKSRRTEILSAYHPEIREKMVIQKRLYGEIADIIYDGYAYPGRYKAWAKDTSFENLREKNHLFNLKCIEIQEMLTTAIIDIINNLENDL